MERHIKGKPRFTVWGEIMPGGGQEYVVRRLDGRLGFPDERLATLTVNGVNIRFHTRREAAKVAREYTKNYVTPTVTPTLKQPIHVRFHRGPVRANDLPAGTRISLEEKQAQLRRRAEFRSDPDLTAADVAIKHSVSTNWVVQRFRDEPGVHPFGPNLFRIPVPVYNRVMNRETKK